MQHAADLQGVCLIALEDQNCKEMGVPGIMVALVLFSSQPIGGVMLMEKCLEALSAYKELSCAVLVTDHLEPFSYDYFPLILFSPSVPTSVLNDTTKICNNWLVDIADRSTLIEFMKRKVLKVEQNYIIAFPKKQIFVEETVFHRYLSTVYVAEAMGKLLISKRTFPFQDRLRMLTQEETEARQRSPRVHYIIPISVPPILRYSVIAYEN